MLVDYGVHVRLGVPRDAGEHVVVEIVEKPVVGLGLAKRPGDVRRGVLEEPSPRARAERRNAGQDRREELVRISPEPDAAAGLPVPFADALKRCVMRLLVVHSPRSRNGDHHQDVGRQVNVRHFLVRTIRHLRKRNVRPPLGQETPREFRRLSPY